MDICCTCTVSALLFVNLARADSSLFWWSENLKIFVKKSVTKIVKLNIFKIFNHHFFMWTLFLYTWPSHFTLKLITSSLECIVLSLNDQHWKKSTLTLLYARKKLVRTFHQCSRTTSRQSILGDIYLVIIKENKIILFCAPWMWKLLHKD